MDFASLGRVKGKWGLKMELHLGRGDPEALAGAPIWRPSMSETAGGLLAKVAELQGVQNIRMVGMGWVAVGALGGSCGVQLVWLAGIVWR